MCLLYRKHLVNLPDSLFLEKVWQGAARCLAMIRRAFHDNDFFVLSAARSLVRSVRSIHMPHLTTSTLPYFHTCHPNLRRGPLDFLNFNFLPPADKNDHDLLFLFQTSPDVQVLSYLYYFQLPTFVNFHAPLDYHRQFN